MKKLINKKCVLDFDTGLMSTDPNGFWHTKARFARPGIQEYNITELSGLPGIENHSGDTVKVLRPKDVVFNAASMASFERKPITVEHEGGEVTPDTAKGVMVGATSYPVEREGDMLVVPVSVYDVNARNEAEKKERYQLSAGYDGTFEYNPGVDETYGEYDVIMSDWIGNHITITRQGKAGEGFYIGDKKMDQKVNGELVKRKVSGVEYDFTPQSAQVFDSVLADRDAFRERCKELKGKLDKAEKSVLDAKQIEQLAIERSDVISGVKSLLPKFSFTTEDGNAKTTQQIVQDAVKELYPNKEISKDTPEGYVRGLLDSKIDFATEDTEEQSEDGDDADEPVVAVNVNDSKSVYQTARQKFIEENSGR
jgi:hypothetical protein